MSDVASNVIWVSVGGSDRNSGSATSPVKTIQHAIEIATPGTTIMVKAGTYVENVQISGSVNAQLKNLTADKPLAIVSADGPGAAVIEGADKSGLVSTVYTIAMSHMTIDGFHIVSNVSRQLGANDGGPLKVIGNPDVTDPSVGVVIENNTFSGTGVSMLKVTCTEGALIANNSFEGTVHQNFIDMVTVWDTTIVSNDFIGQAWLGITMKNGSHDNLVQHNYFDFENHSGKATQTGILVGGVGYSRETRDPLPDEFNGYEARNISVIENVFAGQSDFGVMFQGGVESLVQGNVFANAGGVAVKSATSPSNINGSISRDNTIEGNILVTTKVLHETFDAAPGYAFEGNLPGTLEDAGFDYGQGSFDGDGGSLGGDGGLGGGKLILRAAGSGAPGAAPTFEVFADGVSLGVASIGNPTASLLDPRQGEAYQALFRDYAFDLKGARPDRIEIVYSNDGRSGEINRDLAIDSITLAGVTLQSEAAGYFTARNGSVALSGARELLYVNGTLVFDDLGAALAPKPVNKAPVIEAPAAFEADENETMGLRFRVVDPDSAAGTVAAVLTREDGTAVDPGSYGLTALGDGEFRFVWSPGETQDGRYSIALTADDGAASSSATVALTIREIATAPVFEALPDVTLREGGTAAFTVRAVDLDGHSPALSMVLVREEDGSLVDPAAYRFTDRGDGTGRFVWATGEADDGAYVARITADDGGLRTTTEVAVVVEEVPVTLTVRAAGVGTPGVAPLFELIVDGQSQGITALTHLVQHDTFRMNNDAIFRDYSFSIAGGAPERVEIRYINDGTSGRINRDLAIDYIAIDGEVFESEAAGWFSPDSGNARFAGARELLYVNGTLAFEDLAYADTLLV